MEENFEKRKFFMSLLQEIENYIPGNQQEEQDKIQMLWFIKNYSAWNP